MQFEKYLNAESRVLREALEDHRIHCCLYFIAPTGHRCVCVYARARGGREGGRCGYFRPCVLCSNLSTLSIPLSTQFFTGITHSQDYNTYFKLLIQ